MGLWLTVPKKIPDWIMSLDWWVTAFFPQRDVDNKNYEVHLRQVFDELDADRSGEISTEEIREWLGRKQMVADSDTDTASSMMASIDVDGDDSISFDEFVAAFGADEAWRDAFARKSEFDFGTSAWFHSGKLRNVFDDIDADGGGSVTTDELEEWLTEHSQKEFSEEQITVILEMCDTDSDGEIEFNEFFAAFKHVLAGGVGVGSMDELALAVVREMSTLTGVSFGSELSVASHLHSMDPSRVGLCVLAGGCGGIASRTVVAPLERITIMQQCAREAAFGNVVNVFKQIWRTEGVVGMYRGNLFSCLKVFPFGGLVTLTYATMNAAIADQVPHCNQHMQHLAAGACAGMFATAVTYPLDVLRARAALGETGTSIREVARTLGQHQVGTLRSLYHGMGATMFAMTLFVGFQNTSYDALKHVVCGPEYLNQRLTVPLAVSMGISSACLTQTCVHPIDTFRRRLQTTERSLREVVRQSFLAGQAKHLFRGLVASYLKVLPAVAISVTTRDFVLGRIN